jgi:hypothetical protein
VNERCDKADCPAEAIFRVSTWWTGPLFFCGHHERDVGPDLIADGGYVTRISVGAAL